MDLHFLGTTGYHPNETRHTACMMIPELGLVLDAGTGMFRVGPLLETETLEIFLTHAHLDHSMGLTFLFDILHGRSINTVRVYGEGAKLKALEEHLFSPLLFPIKPPCDFRPHSGDHRELLKGGVVKWFPLEHPGGSLGYRVDAQGKKLAYVTDTTASPTAEYVNAIRGVDVLVHECYFPDGEEERAALTGHSCSTPVAEVAKAAGVGQLYLVHINPLDEEGSAIHVDQMRKIFPETHVATDGMVTSIG